MNEPTATTNATLNANRQIARAAGTVMLALVISQIAGLVQSILIAHTFGTQRELDAFYAANRVSETLFVLVSAGALSSAFIPAFTTFLAKDDRKSAWKLASAVANLVLLTLSLLAALAAFFAPQIVRYALSPGLANDPALFSLTVDLLRIQLVSSVLFGLGGLVVAILNSHQVFFVPALTPAMYRLGMIFGVLALAPRMGIYGLAWGANIGAVFYLALQIPSLVRQKGTYTLSLGLKNPAVGEVLRLMGPRVFGVAIVQLNFWVNIWLASQMTEGSVSAVTYGFTFMLMAQAAIAQSVATAAMPTLSAQYALGKMDELRNTLSASLRGVILLSLPASLGLILLRGPVIAMIYERGAFDAQSTQMVAWALLWYAAGLVGHSLLEVLARAFYALHDTKTPVLVGAAAMSLNVVFSFAFSALFTSLGWMPHGGLALANSLATALEAVTLFVLMRRRLKSIEGANVARGFGQAVLATLGMSLALLAWLQFASQYSAWVVTLGGVLVGGALYGLGVWALQVPEVHSAIQAIQRKLSG
ncbi:MAG: murein biosynthesis integral membrane protein MurJ [Anaerolineae bacterium CG_4_9_14_0_8_um_filter_58_9]|nr:MAG: murein biosynthesis integral membrane protein MurJ [Anaerolineae bacterium CG_4_9_14_0_8_um_filter_58_9]